MMLQTDNKRMLPNIGRVLALFTDGTVCEVIMGTFATGKTDSDPLHIYDIGFTNEVKYGVKNALFATRQALIHSRYMNARETSCFVCQFDGNVNVMQQSASLAFAVKMVQKILKIPFDIAATGVVSNALPDTPVQPVDNIDEKIQAAVKELRSGSLVLIPEENQGNLSSETYAELNNKKIYLESVHSISDTVSKIVLFSEKKGFSVKRKAPSSPFFHALSRLFSKGNGTFNNIRSTHHKITQQLAEKITPTEKILYTSIFFIALTFFPGFSYNQSKNHMNLQINLQGNDPVLIDEIEHTLKKRYKANSISSTEINNHNGTLIGWVSSRIANEIPLTYHPTSSQIVIQMESRMEALKILSLNGEIVNLGDYSAVIETTKDKIDELPELLSRTLVEQLFSAVNIDNSDKD